MSNIIVDAEFIFLDVHQPEAYGWSPLTQTLRAALRAFASRTASTTFAFARLICRYVWWLFSSSERHSYLYEPSMGARLAIASVVSKVSGLPLEECASKVHSLARNTPTLRTLSDLKAQHGPRLPFDSPVTFGKHLAYATLVELCQPLRILEIGTYHGFGTKILADAARPHGGRVWTVDYREHKPSVISSIDSNVEFHLFDIRSREFLSWIDSTPFDMLIYDAIPDFVTEFSIFQAVLNLNPDAIVCANWHATGSLFELACKFDVPYHTLHIEPKAHWYKGTTIGVSRRPTSSHDI